MRINSTQAINNSVLYGLSYGREIGEILNNFLKMKMENDLGVARPLVTKSPSISDIKINLLGNGVIDEKDFGIKLDDSQQIPVPQLVVHIAPDMSLTVERENGKLTAKLNGYKNTTISLLGHSAEAIAMWIIRQKQNYESLMEEWQAVLKKEAKKIKGDRMAMLAIKAIFKEAMKGYPHIHYEFIEQKRRVCIRVKLPNSRLGVYIYAWWGSYKETLPQQIEDLKALVNIHRKTSLKDFYIPRK